MCTVYKCFLYGIPFRVHKWPVSLFWQSSNTILTAKATLSLLYFCILMINQTWTFSLPEFAHWAVAQVCSLWSIFFAWGQKLRWIAHQMWPIGSTGPMTPPPPFAKNNFFTVHLFKQTQWFACRGDFGRETMEGQWVNDWNLRWMHCVSCQHFFLTLQWK